MCHFLVPVRPKEWVNSLDFVSAAFQGDEMKQRRLRHLQCGGKQRILGPCDALTAPTSPIFMWPGNSSVLVDPCSTCCRARAREAPTATAKRFACQADLWDAGHHQTGTGGQCSLLLHLAGATVRDTGSVPEHQLSPLLLSLPACSQVSQPISLASQ